MQKPKWFSFTMHRKALAQPRNSLVKCEFFVHICGVVYARWGVAYTRWDECTKAGRMIKLELPSNTSLYLVESAIVVFNERGALAPYSTAIV